MHHPHGRKFPPEKWDRLLSPERHAFLDPEWVLDRLGVRAGMRVADLGAGPGFFTLPLAARVGAGGTVYATDVAPAMLEALRSRGIPPQVRPLLADEARIPIPDAAVDLALVAFVLHEVVHPAEFLAEVRRILAAGGRLAVLEWIPQDDGMGPPEAERLAEAHARALLADAGFQVVDHGFANTSQYLLVASPRPAG
ncbi:MAG TPA: methyltransferase domain-containing protein [Gemmatimonadaceae bacterium]